MGIAHGFGNDAVCKRSGRKSPHTQDKGDWDNQTEELRDRMRLLLLGGIGRENTKILRTSPGAHGEAREHVFNITLRTPMIATPDRHSSGSEPSTPEREEYRLGGKEEEGRKPLGKSQPSAPNVHIPERLGTQQSSNAMVGKSLVGETIELLLSSLAQSTQTTYLRCWKRWIRYCESRGATPWVGPSKKDWGVAILNYLTSEYSVMKIGGSCLGARCSAIKFLHAVEGWRILKIRRIESIHPSRQ